MAPAALADGRYFGYIRSVEATGAPVTIAFDRAEFLVGKAANRAARADGKLPAGESIPNDYYIRNRDRHVVTLALSPNVRITAVRCVQDCREGYKGDEKALLASFSGHRDVTFAGGYRGAGTQYWVTIRSGRVTVVDEQYLP